MPQRSSEKDANKIKIHIVENNKKRFSAPNAQNPKTKNATRTIVQTALEIRA